LEINRSKCRDYALDKLPGKAVCEKHQELRRLNAQKQAIKKSIGKQKGPLSRSMTAKLKVVTEVHDKTKKRYAPEITTEPEPQRELYRVVDRERALEVVYARDAQGNDYVVENGSYGNRVVGRKCAGCDLKRILTISGDKFIVTEKGTHSSHEAAESSFLKWLLLKKKHLTNCAR
jgi:hypothetical protein